MQKPYIFLIKKVVFIINTGDGSECPLDWVRRVDFGACYFFSYSQKSWNDAQVIGESIMLSIFNV